MNRVGRQMQDRSFTPTLQPWGLRNLSFDPSGRWCKKGLKKLIVLARLFTRICRGCVNDWEVYYEVCKNYDFSVNTF